MNIDIGKHADSFVNTICYSKSGKSLLSIMRQVGTATINNINSKTILIKNAAVHKEYVY